jgi:hypothetical protein
MVGAGLFLAGCGSEDDSLMPMAVGKTWEYETPPPIGPGVTTLTVTRRVPVAGREGYELKMRYGTSRMVWKDGRLLASETAGAHFAPALPIYVADKARYPNLKNKKGELVPGQMTFCGQTMAMEAIITRRPDREKLRLATETFMTEVVDARLEVGADYYILTTYFANGVGIVQQDLRKFSGRQDTLVARLKLLSRPTMAGKTP